jgi:hypothetical protein
MKLGGIIYLYDISQRRMLDTTLTTMEMFRELCGYDALKAVFLLTTGWGDVDVKVGIKREEQLSSDFWKPMLNEGSTICQFDNTPAGAQVILDSICTRYKEREVSTTLRFQEKVMYTQKRTLDTDADRKLWYAQFLTSRWRRRCRGQNSTRASKDC